MRKSKECEGMTLIALIITIIVMLILAGVTISIAMQGGLFEIAINAVTKTKQQTDEEILKVAIAGALNVKTGVIEKEKLVKNLPDWDVQGEESYICISPNGNEFLVDIKGNAEDITNLERTSLVRLYKEGKLKQGDYVAYTPDKRMQAYDIDQGQGKGALTGTELGQAMAQEELDWRVLGYDKANNNILLISGAPTKLAISFLGHIGYNNYEKVLNDTCKAVYSKEGIGTARNITIEDIDNYLDGTNYNKTQFGGGETSPGGYGYTKSFTNKYHPQQWDGKWSGTITSNWFEYTITDYITDQMKLDILKGKGEYNYFIATRFECVTETNVSWRIGNVRRRKY